jgi:predicted nucleic acid-binding protein
LSLVLDSSVTLAWVYSDEATAAVREVITKVVAGGVWVSSLWHLEVANVLEMGVRRGRHTAEFRDATLIDLALFPITTDAETEKQAWGATLQMASRNRLTVYDAAYLELAKRRDLPLATLDEDLRTAARAEGVGLLGV